MSVSLYPPVYELEEVNKQVFISQVRVLMSSIPWAQCTVEKQTHNENWHPMWGPMVVRHFQYQATNITASILCLTA